MIEAGILRAKWICIIICELNCFVAESQLIKYAFQFWSGWLKNLCINRWELPHCSSDLYLSGWLTGPRAGRHYYSSKHHSLVSLGKETGLCREMATTATEMDTWCRGDGSVNKALARQA